MPHTSCCRDRAEDIYRIVSNFSGVTVTEVGGGHAEHVVYFFNCMQCGTGGEEGFEPSDIGGQKLVMHLHAHSYSLGIQGVLMIVNGASHDGCTTSILNPEINPQTLPLFCVNLWGMHIRSTAIV